MTPGTHVRVTGGPHKGRDGKLLSISHGVAEVESWLDREEILIVLEGDCSPLAECPAEHVPATRKSLAAGLRAIVVQLETLRGGCVSTGDHQAAREIFRAQGNLSALAGKLT